MFGGDPIRGHVETIILGALREGPTHGYGLIVRLRDLSDGAFDLKEGTVYPALHRLERDGKLASGWKRGHRPASARLSARRLRASRRSRASVRHGPRSRAV